MLCASLGLSKLLTAAVATYLYVFGERQGRWDPQNVQKCDCSERSHSGFQVLGEGPRDLTSVIISDEKSFAERLVTRAQSVMLLRCRPMRLFQVDEADNRGGRFSVALSKSNSSRADCYNQQQELTQKLNTMKFTLRAVFIHVESQHNPPSYSNPKYTRSLQSFRSSSSAQSRHD
ncbi:uncharacterized protein BDR25DRAFT_363005 [Lindgomyces ingoldianus]|uniref:Uncharacterized protein n=1 Tax=Lindgomyces ingoldianus TaxID=673940 RepID=A0ACB6Q9S3_9PLEO|nr:uncharacterized protein BDR25DRAFT_363005 [Lindgomyces ingoldianus]KAF2463285.1 hypothetical protein BDR25DRAFT_363005 [Lindgomyces ingoldianus]